MRADLARPSHDPIAISSALFAALASSALAWRCGSEPPRRVELALGSTYDAVSVLRILPDGSSPTGFREAYMTFDGLRVSGGRLSGTVAAKNGGAPISLSGTFDAHTGQLQFERATGALTSSRAEMITELGGRGNERIQKDGVADEIVGFIELARGRSIERGSLLAVARDDRRPPIPIEARIAITPAGLGMVKVAGQNGAVVSSGAVEIFRFELARQQPPSFTLATVGSNGSFSIVIPGLTDDVFLIRARVAGTTSDSRFFRVTP